MKKILVLPGWMRALQFYNPENDFQLQFGKIDLPVENGDVVIGMSLGALIVLRESSRISGKVVLVNPPLPKRSIFHWVISLVRMIVLESPFNNRQKFIRNPLRFAAEIVNCIKLLTTDFDAIISQIPKNRLTVIRGNGDTFFADEKAVAYLHSKNVNLIEVESGHNWSEAIESNL